MKKVFIEMIKQANDFEALEAFLTNNCYTRKSWETIDHEDLEVAKITYQGRRNKLIITATIDEDYLNVTDVEIKG